jgi:hypothetical protein
MRFKQFIKEQVKGSNEDIAEFIYQTHYIENEVPKGQEKDFRELVEGWVDFAFGDANRPPSDAHRGITGHITVLQKYAVPKTIADIAKIYKELGENDVMRSKGHDVQALGSKVNYSKGETVHNDLTAWLKDDKGKMGTIDSHARFELVHPFDDGNGRSGRLILLLAGYPIAKLNKLIANKGQYISALEKATK